MKSVSSGQWERSASSKAVGNRFFLVRKVGLTLVVTRVFKTFSYAIVSALRPASDVFPAVYPADSGKRWRKLMNFIKLCLSVICLLFVYTIAFPVAYTESYFAPYPHIDTKLAPGFSEVKFNNIQLGFTKNEVLNILGEPLYKVEAATWSRWSYSEDGRCQWLCDLAWMRYEINFDNEGKVRDKERAVSMD